MRRILFSFSAVLLASTAFGATSGPFNCTPFPVTFPNGAGGPTPVSCQAFAVAGATLNSVTLNYSIDYQFGAATNTVQLTFVPAGPAGVTWALPSTTLASSGGPSSGGIVTGSATAASGVTAANFAAAFNVNISSTVITGAVATSSGAVTVTYDYTAAPPPPPPPPPPGPCNPSILTFTPGVPNAFQARYFSNLAVGDSVINITNTGASSTTAFPTQNGNLCANVFTFSPDEQLISCCACPVTPNGLVSLSARNDLISNTLTPGVPTSVVVKLVASNVNGGLVDGLAAWGTTLHALPTTPGSPAGTFGATETKFTGSTLSAAELQRISTLCGFIQTNGSGFGICRSCRLGGLGAVAQ